MNKFTKLVEAAHLKKDIPQFNVGDTIDVLVKIVEEGKSRAQTFEGIVIAKKGTGLGETFTVRKISYGEGVERVFPLHTPSIEKIVVIKKGDVKRAKLYYLKKKIGKDTKVEEKIEHSEDNAATPPREESK
ncbi:MAG: 50S ribosomal protein L19 [Candidatus Omnitrophica bacterium]|nr:50S ribosomal protein L19 [Candidatus Omnitrophota bacterium]